MNTTTTQKRKPVVLSSQTVICSCSDSPGKPRRMRNYQGGFSANGWFFSDNVWFECSNCGTPTNVFLYDRHGSKTEVIDYAKIYVKEDKVTLSIGVSTYVYNKNVNKIGYKKNRLVYTYSHNTGFVYKVMDGRRIHIVSYRTEDTESATGEWIDRVREQYPEIYKDYVDATLKMRGIYDYMSKEQFESCAFDPSYLFILLRFPVMVNLPPFPVNGVDKKYRKPLLQAKGIKDVYSLLFGVKSKGIIREFNNLQGLLSLKYWSRAITRPDNLRKLVRHTSSFGFYQQNSPSLFLLQDSDDYFEESLLKKYFDKCDRLSCLMEIINCDETRLTNLILKHFDEDSYGINTIEDIPVIYANIKENNPEYVLPKWKTLQELHDYLATYHRMQCTPNETFQYSQDELDKLNMNVGGYEFRLAEDVYRLYDIGQQLSHCVASYSNAVLSKRLNIVQVYKDNQYVITMEVSRGKILQALGYLNKEPHYDTCKVIEEYARLADLEISTLSLRGRNEDDVCKPVRYSPKENILVAV